LFSLWKFNALVSVTFSDCDMQWVVRKLTDSFGKSYHQDVRTISIGHATRTQKAEPTSSYL